MECPRPSDAELRHLIERSVEHIRVQQVFAECNERAGREEWMLGEGLARNVVNDVRRAMGRPLLDRQITREAALVELLEAALSLGEL